MNAQQLLNTILTDKTTNVVQMEGTDLDKKSKTRVFYNPSLDQVALTVDYLPIPPKGKQYQLWAIVDGNPTDMGVLDSSCFEDILLIDFAEQYPAAFAITLEAEGGNPTPDLSQLYVIGNV